MCLNICNFITLPTMFLNKTAIYNFKIIPTVMFFKRCNVRFSSFARQGTIRQVSGNPPHCLEKL